MFGGFIQLDKHRSRKLSQEEEIKAGVALTQINKSTNTHKNEDGVIEIKTDQFLWTCVRWGDRAAVRSAKVINLSLMLSHRKGKSRFKYH